MSTTQAYDGAPRQPATVTVVQTLLVLSALGSAVGLIVSIYLVSVVLDPAGPGHPPPSAPFPAARPSGPFPQPPPQPPRPNPRPDAGGRHSAPRQ